MRVLIVDDEPLARLRLASLLAQCEGVELVGSVDDGEAALAALVDSRAELVLIDINMPGLDGIGLATRLRREADAPKLVFCTAYEQHAIKAFELGAIDYLLKPVRLERLRETLQRARSDARPAPPAPVYLHGRRGSEQVRIALDQVICLLAEEKYVVVQHVGGELLIETSLRQLELAHPERLTRLHRNCLVPWSRLLGLRNMADGRVLARLAGSEQQPEVSRRNLPTLRRRLRGD